MSQLRAPHRPGWMRALMLLYRGWLRLVCPPRLRRRYGPEMVQAFGLLLDDEVARRGGVRGTLAAWTRVVGEVGGMRGVAALSRDSRGGEAVMKRSARWGRGMLQDLGFAWRSLRRDLRFTGLVVGILGLAMALNVAVFSVVNAYLLRPLPYPYAERVVSVRPVTDVGWTQVDHLFEKAVSWDLDAFTLVGEPGPRMVLGSWVTPDFLDVYGVRAALGRTFLPEEADPGAAPVAMISHALWQERFGGRPDVVGRSFEAFTSDRPDHAESFRIVGVLPADFWHVNAYTEVFAPMRVERAVYVGRLRPDVPLEVAEAGLNTLARATTAELPADFRVRLVPVQEAYVRAVKPRLTLLQGAVLLVLLIAAANTVVLLLVRTAAREREVGVRQALGAPRGRLAAQLTWEGVLLAGGAGVVGVAGAALALDLVRSGVGGSLGQGVPGGASALYLDGTVLAAAAVGSGLLALLYSVIPSLLVLGREGAGRILGAGSRGGTDTRGRRRARDLMVVAEVALSMALLAGAGLMARSAVNLHAEPLGFAPEGVMRGSIGLRQASYPDEAQRRNFFESVVRDVRGLESVEAAALASSTPFSAFISPVPVEGETSEGRRSIAALGGKVASVGPGYFDAMRIAVRRGRDFGPQDLPGSAPVAIISEGIAQRLFDGADPVGMRIRLVDEDDGPGAWHTVVGVAGDIIRDLDYEDEGQVYLPYAQATGFWMAMVIRTRPGAVGVEEQIRAVVQRHDPQTPFSSVADVGERVAAARAPARFSAVLLGLFSAFALLLALVGLYGVVAYAARQRRRDVAVRMALGADSSSVAGAFLRQGLRVVAAGVALGLVGGLFLGRAVADQLRGVGPADPLTHAGVAMLLFGTAALAVWLPARQAAHTSPMGVLREE